MKQAVLGYEQKFFINGTQLSGVQSVNGSYAISEKPINVLGWGYVNADFYNETEYIVQSDGTSFILDDQGFAMLQETSCPGSDAAPTPGMAVLNAPLEGQFSINSTLVSEDFFLNYTGDIPFTGSINHGTKYFGFYNGYITNHSVTCSIGEIPKTSTSIKVFGDIGGSPDYFQVQESDGFMLQEDGFLMGTEDSIGEQNYNASGTNPFPAIRVPNQGSIIVECTGASTDRVTSFSHSIDMPLDAIYTVGSSVAAQVDVIWPFTTTTSFSLDIDKYNYQRLRAYLRAPTVQDIAVKINDCFGDTIQNYEVKNARLIGEQMSANSQGRLTVNLQYKSYYNKR
jgi:hypothetical protein